MSELSPREVEFQKVLRRHTLGSISFKDEEIEASWERWSCALFPRLSSLATEELCMPV